MGLLWKNENSSLSSRATTNRCKSRIYNGFIRLGRTKVGQI